MIESTRSSTPGRAGSRYIRDGRDALLEQRRAGPVERRLRCGCGCAPRGPTPSRSSPCTNGRRRPGPDRRRSRRCRRTRSRSSRSRRPAASASATSRGYFTPPSAQTVAPVLGGRGRALQHRGELRPADAGHHPGGAHRARTDADLDDVGAGVDQIGGAARRRPRCRRPPGSGGRSRPRTRPGPATTTASDSIIFSWWPCAVSTTSTSARAASSASRLAGDVAVDADGRADQQVAGRVDRRGVDRRAQHALAGQHAEHPVAVEHRHHVEVPAGHHVEGVAQVVVLGRR